MTLATFAAPPLVDLRLSGAAQAAALDRAPSLARLVLDRNQVLDVEKLANGTFTPLKGFMGARDFEAVVADGRLADGSPWTIPVVLQTTAEVADRFREGQ